MVVVKWRPQTPEPWDPPSTILTIKFRIGGVTLDVEGVFDTGADMNDLQPPKLAEFQNDPDHHGFSADPNLHGQPRLIPIVIATGELDGHTFEAPLRCIR